MSRSFPEHLVSPGCQPGSARQDPLGLPGQSEVGAALHSPRGAAPTQLSAAGLLTPRQTASPPVAVVAAAALTIFEGQAVFRLIAPAPSADIQELFRLGRGSRFHSATDNLP